MSLSGVVTNGVTVKRRQCLPGIGRRGNQPSRPTGVGLCADPASDAWRRLPSGRCVRLCCPCLSSDCLPHCPCPGLKPNWRRSIPGCPDCRPMAGECVWGRGAMSGRWMASNWWPYYAAFRDPTAAPSSRHLTSGKTSAGLCWLALAGLSPV